MVHNLCSWLNLLSTISSQFWQLQLFFFLWNIKLLYLNAAGREARRILASEQDDCRREEYQSWYSLAHFCPRASCMGNDDNTYQCRLLLSWLCYFTCINLCHPHSKPVNYVIGCIVQRNVLSPGGELISPGQITDTWQTEQGSKLGSEFNSSHIYTMGSRYVPLCCSWWIWKEKVDHTRTLFNCTVVLNIGIPRNKRWWYSTRL